MTRCERASDTGDKKKKRNGINKVKVTRKHLLFLKRVLWVPVQSVVHRAGTQHQRTCRKCEHSGTIPGLLGQSLVDGQRNLGLIIIMQVKSWQVWSREVVLKVTAYKKSLLGLIKGVQLWSPFRSVWCSRSEVGFRIAFLTSSWLCRSCRSREHTLRTADIGMWRTDGEFWNVRWASWWKDGVTGRILKWLPGLQTPGIHASSSWYSNKCYSKSCCFEGILQMSLNQLSVK